MRENERESVSRGAVIAVIILVLLAVAAAGFLVYTLRIGGIEVMNANSSVSVCAVSEERERFVKDRVLASGNALPGAILQDTDFANEDGLEYVFYSVRIRNNNLIPAETVELSPVVQPSDILYYTTEEKEVIIPPMGYADITLIMMRFTNTETMPRSIKITFYYMGEEQEEMLEL